MTVKPTFFATPAGFRAWLENYHDQSQELWVGYYKKATGKPSITWPESVDEALCFGWIDGLRKRIDEESYMIRFTPRRETSTWSAVNIERVAELIAQERMHPAGLKAFEKRTAGKSGAYAYEQREPLNWMWPRSSSFEPTRKPGSSFKTSRPVIVRRPPGGSSALKKKRPGRNAWRPSSRTRPRGAPSAR
jgi:hypothetical protein